MFNEQKIRTLLFYLCVAVFIISLPFILSFALGYKFDTRTFRFKKTGLISIKTQPGSAAVYFNSKLLKEKTPATITELLPGEYGIKLELKEHYPWVSRVKVEGGKVTQLEKIILFPVRPNIKQLNKENVASFWFDKDKEEIYYFDQETQTVYKSDLEGDNFEEIARIPGMVSGIKKWRVSSNRKLFVCFNQRQAAVASLEPQKKDDIPELPFVSNFSNRRIFDVFWHSDNYHLILVTDKTIEAKEARPNAASVILASLNKRGGFVSYDGQKDTLYFIDSQMAEDRRFYDNVYKLELGTKSFSFNEE